MSRKLCRIFITMFFCYGIGSFMVVIDLSSVPVHDFSWYRNNPQWRIQNVEYATSTWEFCLGDGEVTALENILIWIPLLFGFMRTIDFFRAWHDEEKEQMIGFYFKRVE